MVAMNLCPTCRKMLYRTDACKGVGVECGRTDGGSTKMVGQGAHVTLADQNGAAEVAHKLSPAERSAGPQSESRVQRAAAALPIAAPSPRKRGRPSTGFDKKAYDREQSRKRRAKIKEAK